MTTWGAFRTVPERVWIDWDESRWLLPFPVMGVALLAVAERLNLHLLSGRRSGGLIFVLGFAWAALSGWVTFLWRQRIRRRVAQRAAPDDWVCPRCLHHEDAARPTTGEAAMPDTGRP